MQVSLFAVLFLFVCLPAAANTLSVQDPSAPSVLTYEGTSGPGEGKHIVLLAGDEEYRSEEALPMLARILAVHHGFRCTVLFCLNPETGSIQPDNQTFMPGLHLLATADLAIVFLRFREFPDEEMRHFVNFIKSGKPVIGIRTATHAFDYRRNLKSRYRHWSWRNSDWPGGFGQQVLGETWVAHHGKHGEQSTRGLPVSEERGHPVLRGVHDIWGPTDVYTVKNLGKDARVLVHGQVLQGMQPSSPPLPGAKNEPMMPLVWVRDSRTSSGAVSRVLCSTIGAATDFQSEDLRRLMINACYWGLGLEDAIPEQARVDYVGDYDPSPFGFGKFRRGVRPMDWALDSRTAEKHE